MSWPENFVFVTYCRRCPEFQRVETEDFYEWRLAIEKHYADTRHVPSARSKPKEVPTRP